MADSELDRIDPEPKIVPLSTGYEVRLQRLRTRQFFRLLKVLTRGVGPAVVQSLDFKDDPDQFGSRLLAITFMAIPEAEQQFIEFLQSMCQPVGLHEGPNLDKQQRADNQAAILELVEELNNPELEDLLDLAEAIVKQEAKDIQSLGKRVARLIDLARKTGQLEDKTSEETDSSDLSASLSISSLTSTDGLTSTSLTSRSAGSGSASRRRRPAASVSS